VNERQFNIIVDNNGEHMVDDQGHLVLARSLGINRFGKSANGAFMQSELGARDSLFTPPYYLNASYTAYSAYKSTFYSSAILEGHSNNATSGLFFAKDANAISSPFYFHCGVWNTNQVGGMIRAVLGATYDLNASYPANTTFDFEINHGLYEAPFTKNASPLLWITADNHALYNTVPVSKTVKDWEIAARVYGYTFGFSTETIRIRVLRSRLAPYFGSRFSIVFTSYIEEYSTIQNPISEAFLGKEASLDFSLRPITMIPRILVTPP
jgi:hypothetical protein